MKLVFITAVIQLATFHTGFKCGLPQTNTAGTISGIWLQMSQIITTALLPQIPTKDCEKLVVGFAHRTALSGA